MYQCRSLAPVGVIYRLRNMKIVVRTKDHPPPHVHVIGPGGAEMKIEIEPLEVKKVRGFNSREVRRVVEFLRSEFIREELVDAWWSTHGEEDR